MLKINICKKYYGKRQILKDISFNVKNGEMILLLAPSGCGKTTLLNAIIGNTSYNGTVSNEDGGKIIYVEQFSTLNENETVYNSVYYTGLMDYKDVPIRQIKMLISNKLKCLGIWQLNDREIAKISGGQKRRAQICEALIRKNANTFILDEPTTGLDSWSSHRLLKDLYEMAKKNNSKIIVVSHESIPDNLKLFSKILVLAKDKDNISSIAFFGSYNKMLDYFGESTVLNIMEKIQTKDEGGQELGGYYINKYKNKTKIRWERTFF